MAHLILIGEADVVELKAGLDVGIWSECRNVVAEDIAISAEAFEDLLQILLLAVSSF